MDTFRVFSLIFFVLVVMIRATDASSRVLMADEKPNPEKASPSPTPNSPPVNKELNQIPQPKPVESPPDTKKEPAESPPVTKKEEGTKESKNSPNGNKVGGMQENQGPPKNDEKKNDDKRREKNDPSKSPENPKKDDGPKGGNSSAKSQENTKKDDGRKEGEGPPTSKENNEKNDEKQGGNVPNINESHIDKSQLETCDGSLLRCEHQDLVACLQHSKIDPKELTILVQNAGGNTLDVNIVVPPSVTIDAKNLNLAKHSAGKVNISAGATKTLKIVLDAGKGQCVIQFGSGPSISDWVQQFPAYARQLTPMYGAYFMFFILVIVGGVWGFCKFRSRRRADDGVAYQQLEMGTQRQSSTEIVEEATVDGWEQGWDDDWDEEEAATRPITTRPNGNISANGLSSRSANKNNDWDIEWDD